MNTLNTLDKVIAPLVEAKLVVPYAEYQAALRQVRDANDRLAKQCHTTQAVKDWHFRVTAAEVRRAEAAAREQAVATADTERGKEWQTFADAVLNHIETYTVPQYGDAPDDNVSQWTAAECLAQVGRYASRAGRNQREGQDLLDLLKIAHYAALAWSKLRQTD